MKTYAPKHLNGADLRGLMADLLCTPAQAATYLKVTERSIWRWLADDSAPFAVLSALWHETPRGREVTAYDVTNEIDLLRLGERCARDAVRTSEGQVRRLLAISDTGAANDPLETLRNPPPRPTPPGRKKAALEPPFKYRDQA